MDDDIPPGAAIGGSSGGESWTFVSKPSPVFSGEKAHTQDATRGQVQHLFLGSKPIVVDSDDDVLYAYVYIDSTSAPKEIMLQFNSDGLWEHRAYWGINSISFGEDNSPARRALGELPKAGEWVRLEVPVKQIGFKAKDRLVGVSFDQVGGRVYWDKVGIVKHPPTQVPGAGDLLWALVSSAEFQYVK